MARKGNLSGGASKSFERRLERVEKEERTLKNENTTIKEYLYILTGVVGVLFIGYFILLKLTGFSVYDFSTGTLSGTTLESKFSHVTVDPAYLQQTGYGLVAYYSFDGDNIPANPATTAYDYSANGLDGTYNGNAAVTSSGCLYGRCLALDGNGDGITISGSSLKNTDKGTIMAWIYLNNNTGACIMDKETPGVNSELILWVGDIPGLSNGNQADGIVSWHVNNGIEGIGEPKSTTALGVGTWYHVAVTFNDTQKVYINSVLEGNVAYSTTLLDNNNDIAIGTCGNNFNGKIDELMIFNESLTAGQISAIYVNTSSRFLATSGKHIFTGIDLGTNTTANITLADYVVPSGTAIGAQVNSSTTAGAIVNFTNGAITNYTLPSGNLTSATLNIIYYTDSNKFLSPLAGGNVSVDGYGEASVDTIAPTLSIAYPGNTTYTYVVSELNYSASDETALSRCWYSLNGGANSTTQACGTNWTGLTALEGSNTWRVYANDTSNNVNYSSRTFFVDSESPFIGLEFDPQNITYNTNTVPVNFSYTDATSTVSSMWYFNGTANVTYLEATSVVLSNGAYTFILYANDTLGNLGSHSVTFSVFVDTTAPTISIAYPGNTTYTYVVSELNYTASDETALSRCRYSLNGGANSTTQACGTNWTGLTAGQGSNTWRVYVNDTSNNVNSSSVTFFTDSIIPTIDYGVLTETNASAISRNNIVVNVTSVDTNLANITIRLYNSNRALLQSNTSSSGSYLNNYTGLSNGVYYFNATATDNVNNQNNTATRIVTIDTTAPTLSIAYPQNVTYNYMVTELNYTTSDNVALSTCAYSTNGGITNTTITCGTNVSLSASEGSNTWSIGVNDTSNNINITSVTFFVDSVNPGINFTTPTPANASLQAANSIYVNLSSNDANQHYSFVNFGNSLIEWLRFENSTSAIDESGLGNSGTLNGGISSVAGRFGNAYSFDGSSGYIGLSSASSTINNMPQGTLSLWVYLNNNTQGTFIVKQHNGQNTMFFLHIDNSNPGVLQWMPHGGISELSSNTLLSTGQWYLVTTTFNTTGAEFYINGQFDNSILGEYSIPNDDSPTYFQIGGASPAFPLLNGTIDDLMVFNRTLSASEILSLYNATTTQYQNNFTGLVTQSYSFTGYSVDIAGNKNNTETRTVLVDTTFPLISYGNLADNSSNVSRNWIFVNVSVTEANEANITFNLYSTAGAVNRTTFSTAIRTINWTGLSDGIYTFNVSVVDITNHINTTSTRSVTVDTTNPGIVYGTRTENMNEFTEATSVFANISYADSNFANITFSLYNLTTGTATLVNSTAFATSVNNINWTGLVSGVYQYQINITDAANNKNATTIRNITLLPSCLTQCTEGSDCNVTASCYLYSSMCSGNICDFGNFRINGTLYTLYDNSGNGNELFLNISNITFIKSTVGNRGNYTQGIVFNGKTGSTISPGTVGGNAGRVNVTVPYFFNTTRANFTGLGGYSTLSGAVGGNGGLLYLQFFGLIRNFSDASYTILGVPGTNAVPKLSAGGSVDSSSGSAGNYTLGKIIDCSYLGRRDIDVNDDGKVEALDWNAEKDNYNNVTTDNTFDYNYDISCDGKLNVIEISKIGFQIDSGSSYRG